MGKHELELIAALAEGRLEDESEARALIASSEKYRTEYEDQKAALDALAEVATTRMTEIEKAALHRDVWTALSAEPVPGKKATPWYFRWSYAVGALFVLVGLAAVLTQGGLPTETANDQRVAPLTASPTETTSPASAAVAEDGEEAPATGGVAEDGTGAPQFLEPDPEFFTEEADRLRAGDFEGTAFMSSTDSELSAEDMTSCLEEAGLDNHDILGLLNYTRIFVEDRDSSADVISYMVAAPGDLELGPDTPVSFVDLLTCELVHTDN